MKLIKNPWLDKEGYNCIGCCPTNPTGFHLSFYEDGDDVVSKWNPTQNHQGWIDTLHGRSGRMGGDVQTPDDGCDVEDGNTIRETDFYSIEHTDHPCATEPHDA